MNANVYRGTDSGEVLCSDGGRAYPIDVLELMGGHGVSWPGPSNGNRQLACSLLYDALGWVPTADICARLEQDITSELYGEFELPVSDVIAWWRAQPETAAGLVYFHGTVPPMTDHRMLEGFAETCRDAGFATYLPHENTAMGGAPMSPVQVERSRRRADELASSRVAYVGPDGAAALDVAASELDVVLLDERAPRDLVARLKGTVRRGIRVDGAARDALVEHLRGSRSGA